MRGKYLIIQNLRKVLYVGHYMTCKREGKWPRSTLFGLPFWVHDLGHCRSEVTRLEDTRRASAYTLASASALSTSTTTTRF